MSHNHINFKFKQPGQEKRKRKRKFKNAVSQKKKTGSTELFYRCESLGNPSLFPA